MIHNHLEKRNFSVCKILKSRLFKICVESERDEIFSTIPTILTISCSSFETIIGKSYIVKNMMSKIAWKSW